MSSLINKHNQKLISIIVPAYNEETTIEKFYFRVSEVMKQIPNYQFELLFIDDGSSDSTRQIINRLLEQDKRVCAIHLSRNFGKEAAMSAGLDFAEGDAVAIFDVDLQDPPELLIQFVEHWERGYDTVYAKRTRREGETWLKKTTATLFYKLIAKISHVSIPPNTGDCRLMSRRVVDELIKLREHHRFMKGLFAWVGFPAIAVEYVRDPRISGTTKFNYFKLWNFALEGITSFTTAPLKIASYIGFFLAFFSFLAGIWIIFKTLYWGEVVQGYPTLIVSLLFLSGLQIMFIGVIGEYIGRIFGESKNRPLYIIDVVRKHRNDLRPTD